ncbi:MAG: hypothetical protein IH797_07190 [Chloroflexi bacterium]|nr:hypothetical protein [Chloroflexota bacterium]
MTQSFRLPDGGLIERDRPRGFRFDGLPAGVYTVALPYDADRTDGTVPVSHRIDVRAGEVARGVKLLVEEGTLVRGSMVNAETGDAVAGVGVRAMQGSSNRGTPVGDAMADENGEYSLRLPSGSVWLWHGRSCARRAYS